MSSQIDLIIAKAKSLIGSYAYDQRCQAFVRICYEAAGIYVSDSPGSATAAYKKYCVSKDKNIPIGAVAYYSNGNSDGHAAIYLGGGQIIHAWGKVQITSMDRPKGYLGWGWQGGTKPKGAGQTTQDSVSTNATSPQKTITLPSGLGSVFTYMGWQCITSKSSQQYKLRDKAGQNFDSEGFGIINNRYVVACTTTYGRVGDYINVYQSNGNVLKCIIGDIKNQSDAGCNKWGHLNGKCVIEFVVDKTTWYTEPMHANPGTSSCHPSWGGKTITKVENFGNYFDGVETEDSSSEKVPLCSTSIVSVVNVGSDVRAKAIRPGVNQNLKFELHIIHKLTDYIPIILDTVTWTTEYADTCGQLKFTVLNDGQVNFTEGDAVSFRVHGKGVFYGYVFEKTKTKDGNIEVTAYDQLRYFKNKDTYCYKNRKYSDMIKQFANDFELTVGDIDDTEYLDTRIEDDISIFDMCKNARLSTLYNTGKLYILYDDFGTLCLKNIKELQTNYWLTTQTAEDFSYKTSIDDNVYNTIQCYKDDDTTGNRDKYIYKDGDLINQWGVLQKTVKLEEDDNPATVGMVYLNLYKSKRTTLKVTGCFGNINLRAGASLYLSLNVGDVNYDRACFFITKATHNFNSTYTCDLELAGQKNFVGEMGSNG